MDEGRGFTWGALLLSGLLAFLFGLYVAAKIDGFATREIISAGVMIHGGKAYSVKPMEPRP